MGEVADHPARRSLGLQQTTPDYLAPLNAGADTKWRIMTALRGVGDDGGQLHKPKWTACPTLHLRARAPQLLTKHEAVYSYALIQSSSSTNLCQHLPATWHLLISGPPACQKPVGSADGDQGTGVFQVNLTPAGTPNFVVST
ncbi:Hypothetical predicted protein [Pelobates cultripes]|uniref:Uncharacterized protein n=1 Tax=Pelobates cultripes TaxID=61616 RepID=A0AAD1RSD2_PELCU|nr:Hypothetical predicted protein [Pelobates cultripes]